MPSTLEESFPGGWNCIRETFLRRGVPEVGLQTIKASLSETTLKQYSSYLKKWWLFCKTNNHDPFLFSLDIIIIFLTEQFQTGNAYSTLNSQHAALVLLFDITASDKAILKRFLKGIYNQRPSRPRYNSTWDPQPVLKFLASLFPLEDISNIHLSMKLVTLLALITGHRLQTFTYICLGNICRYQDRLEIKITDKIKTSSSKNFQPLLVIPYFRENPNLCLASVIDFYILKTRNIRPTNTDKLILTVKKPIRPISSQRLSKWIKMTLEASSIDTTIFSGYSTRHAATSAAHRAGVSIEAIRKRAGWTQNSAMFAKFYNRPLCEDVSAFAKGVLNIL